MLATEKYMALVVCASKGTLKVNLDARWIDLLNDRRSSEIELSFTFASTSIFHLLSLRMACISITYSTCIEIGSLQVKCLLFRVKDSVFDGFKCVRWYVNCKRGREITWKRFSIYAYVLN